MNTEVNKRELKRQLPLELAKRLECTSPQFGKTVFVKMAYLLQELYKVPLGYRFSLYTYGPYSPEVLADLEYAELRRQVNVEYEGEEGFSITPCKSAVGVEGQMGPIINYGDQLTELVEHFGEFDARELELRTTSIFLWKKIRPLKDEDVDSVVETVRHLKPHFDKKTIRLAVDGLLEAGVIRYFSSE